MTNLSTHITLSTAHLAEKVSDMLSAMGEDVEKNPWWGDWRDDIVRCGFAYGHWVRGPRPDPEDPQDTMELRLANFPQCLADCIRHAAQYGARWILFDRDELEVDGLETHDW